jgi:N-acetyltransferase
MHIPAIALHNSRVRLDLLTPNHLDDLTAAAAHDEIWTWLDEPVPFTRDHVADFIDTALHDQQRGTRIPYAILDPDTGQAIGSTSYQDIQPEHHTVEIGWTWTATTYWGTGINIATKNLLIRHAFDTQAERVAMKTDSRNIRSRRAIERTGARYEGTWRRHRICRDGTHRDTRWYSIIATEWSGENFLY